MADSNTNFTDTQNPKEFLTAYPEFQNGITRSISVNGNNSTQKITKDKIDNYIDNMPNYKAQELAGILSGGTPKEKENALHGFLSNVMGNKQEITKQSGAENGLITTLMDYFTNKTNKDKDPRVTTPIDYQAEIKNKFNSELEKLADGKDTISYKITLPNSRVRNVFGLPVDAIKDHANKYIENLSPKETTELYTQMSSTESTRTTAITNIINAAYEANEKARIPIPAVKPQNNQAPQNAEGKGNANASPKTVIDENKADSTILNKQTDDATEVHNVKKGENLTVIAREIFKNRTKENPSPSELNKMINAFVEANKEKLKGNPHLIFAGQDLAVPNAEQITTAPPTPITPKQNQNSV